MRLRGVRLNGDVELLADACQKCQAVFRVVAVAGAHEMCGAGELVIAAEHGLRVIRAHVSVHFREGVDGWQASGLGASWV